MHIVIVFTALLICLTWISKVEAHTLNIHFKPSRMPPKAEHKILDHGLGSKILKKCGESKEQCGPDGASEADCRRFQCCYDKKAKTCTQSTMHIIRWNNTECFYDLENYRGTTSTTNGGKTCINWAAAVNADYFTDYSAHLVVQEEGDHNYCRNPNHSYEGPWCFFMKNSVEIGRDYCSPNIPQCDQGENSCWYDDHRCADTGECIGANAVCNGNYDCSDGSDEMNCDKEKCESHGKFWCEADNKCGPSYYVCTNSDYCSDGADEDFVCDDAKCATIGKVACGVIKNECYDPIYNRCDGHNDCDDGTDEQNCDASVCEYYGRWTCASGDQCTSPHWVCDGYSDCRDGSDEDVVCDAELCGSMGKLSCADNSECYDSYDLCDQIQHCDDGSDELNCDADTCASLGKFHCSDGSGCVEFHDVCDDSWHCDDGEDEIGCDTARCESLGRFHCLDGSECLDYDDVCNGYGDCADDSDEANCDADTCAAVGRFHCDDDSECLDTQYVCDGTSDCSSDEVGCDEARCASLGRFYCANGSKCLRYNKQCNGDDDCGDNSDEAGCVNF